MFVIEFFCGPRFGGWRPAAERFATEAEARSEAWNRYLAELRREITPVPRRVRTV
jgi:hypothetical protein